MIKPVRTFLFVPANKESWIEKSVNSGADALILDLEDSVPHPEKAAAREIVANKIAWLAERKQRVYVRVNRTPHVYDLDDVLAVVQPGLEGIFISKPYSVADVHMASCMIAEAEMRRGMPIGDVGLIPLLETAAALQLAYEIALVPRVTAIVGATAKNADVARALNTIWTPGGRETHYLKARVVMAARAAGKRPIGGLWQQIRDLEGQATQSEADRQLGMDGELVLHPTQVPVVNKIYTPTADQIAFYKGMIEALDAAVAVGRASVIYDGEHIDIAHVKTAREFIALAEELGA